jgi:hypothetical protein
MLQAQMEQSYMGPPVAPQQMMPLISPRDAILGPAGGYPGAEPIENGEAEEASLG